MVLCSICWWSGKQEEMLDERSVSSWSSSSYLVGIGVEVWVQFLAHSGVIWKTTSTASTEFEQNPFE